MSLTDYLSKFKEGYDFSLKNLEESLKTGIKNKLADKDRDKAHELAHNFWSGAGAVAAVFAHPVKVYEFMRHCEPEVKVELREIINAYLLANKAVDFLHELKRKSITKTDLENESYLELSDKFNGLSEQGLKSMKDNPASTIIGVVCYTLKHPIKMVSGQKYYHSNLREED